MTSLQALAICIGISTTISIVLVVAIARPLRNLVARLCPGPEAPAFWLRFTLVMLFLSPLFVAVAFGLPAPARLDLLQTGELVQLIVTASLVGAFIAMFGLGLWVSSLSRRAPALFNAPRTDARWQSDDRSAA
jgi:hypothetical protein